MDLITKTTAMLTADTDPGAWHFARCWLRAAGQPGDPDGALDDFDAIPETMPGRAKLAAYLVSVQLRGNRLREGPAIHRAERLAVVADTDPAPLPEWPAERAVLRSLVLVRLCQEGDASVTPRSALAELAGLRQAVGDRQPHRQRLDVAELAITGLRAEQNQDHEGLRKIAEQAEGFGGVRGEMLAAATTARAAVARGDLPAVTAAAERMRAALERYPPGDLGRPAAEQMLASLAPLLGESSAAPVPGPAETTAGPFADLRRRAAEPGLGNLERALRLSQLGIAETTVPQTADDGVRHLAEAVRIAPQHDARLPYYLLTHGYALIQRYETHHRRPDLDDGIRQLEQARERCGGPAATHWSLVSQMLGHAHRLAGHHDEGRRIALAGLRGHAWSVLLQAHTDAAAAAARDAATDAVDVARWCLQDGAVDDAATALDAGRGLIVYAATRIRGVADQLRDSHPELAARWRDATRDRAPGDVDVELRREVLEVLTARPDRLLDPPSTHEIRAALTALGADALVYLIPGDDGVGAAVAVPAGGPASEIRLPLLTGTAMTDFDIRPQRNRDASFTEPTSERTLGEVCDWAWQAAIGPVLGMLDLPADGSGRIILIPMRELVRVPWHAARDNRGGHAVQRACFSYAASARLVCDTAWSPPVPLTGSGLIVGDPDTRGAAGDLPAARAEALALRDAFYPAARYVGRLADGASGPGGAGTRRDVLDWLADPDGGSVLHLASHAIARPSDSYLLLAGGDRLATEELIAALTAGGGRGVALAALAACDTGVSSRGYDEAFSLATAFLASGVRSVVSSQWPVPDEATSVLMFAFHHFLATGGDGPARALRAAQLWLLDEHRVPLDGMPDPLQERLKALTRPEPADWAGFFHSGH